VTVLTYSTNTITLHGVMFVVCCSMGQLLLTCLAVVAIAQFVMGRFCLGVRVAQEGHPLFLILLSSPNNLEAIPLPRSLFFFDVSLCSIFSFV